MKTQQDVTKEVRQASWQLVIDNASFCHVPGRIDTHEVLATIRESNGIRSFAAPQ